MPMTMSLINGGDNGQLHPSGFIVFTKLATANAALQMILHQFSFAMEVSDAPDPKDGKNAYL